MKKKLGRAEIVYCISQARLDLARHDATRGEAVI